MKKILYILVILIILNLILLVMLLLKKNNKVENNDVISIAGEDLSYELNKKIIPQNHFEFESKIENSKVDAKEIYSAIYNIVKNSQELRTQVANMSENDLQNYFKQNNDSIYSEYGINDFDSFKNFISQMKKIISSDSVFYSNVEIKLDTFKGNNGIKCDINISYNNGKILTLKLVIDSYNTVKFKFVV